MPIRAITGMFFSILVRRFFFLSLIVLSALSRFENAKLDRPNWWMGINGEFE